MTSFPIPNSAYERGFTMLQITAGLLAFGLLILAAEALQFPGRQREEHQARLVAMQSWAEWATWRDLHCRISGNREVEAGRGSHTEVIQYRCGDGPYYELAKYEQYLANACGATATDEACFAHGLPEVPTLWRSRPMTSQH